jgi:ribonuclease T1
MKFSPFSANAATRSRRSRRGSWWSELRAAALVLLLALAAFPGLAREPAAGLAGEIAFADLPPQARETLALIQRGGPFPFRKDGAVFHNREQRLPIRPRGYYRSFTVPTPGSRDRGARRIVAGVGAGNDVATSGEYYYTADHYRTFRRIRQ